MSDKEEIHKKTKLGNELLNACYFGNVHQALRYIKQGAQTDYTDPRDGWSGIHYAARWGLISIVKELVKSGVDINLRTIEKDTPLHKACTSNKKEMVIWLMKNGANPTLMNSNACTASQLTQDDELCYICNNFKEYYKNFLEEKRLEKNKPEKIKNKIDF